MLLIAKKFRQPSFLKFLQLAFAAGALCSCQTQQKKAPASPVSAASPLGTTSPTLVRVPPLPPTARDIAVRPTGPRRPQETPTATTAFPTTAATAATTRRSSDLPESLPGCTITQISANQWRAVSRRRFVLSDSPPSLMEDAIITSGIHARLQNVAQGSKTSWQYSSNAGVVILKTASLTRNEAISAIQAVLGLDKVSEVRLTTRLQ